MAHEFINVGDTAVNLSYVSHVTFDNVGGAVLHTDNGPLPVTGDEADALAKLVGRPAAKKEEKKAAKGDK